MARKKKTPLDRLPLYEMIIDENDVETGVSFISIVENPAIELKGKAFNDHFKGGRGNSDAVGYQPPCHPNCQCEIVGYGYSAEWQVGADPCDFCLANKEFWEDANLRFNEHKFTVNKEQKCIIGAVMIANKQIYRNDEDGEYMCQFSPDTVKKCMKKFMKNNLNGSIDCEHNNQTIKAFVMESWYVRDPLQDTSRALNYTAPKDSWVAIVQIEDDAFWEMDVNELQKCSFSIEGRLGMKLLRMSEPLSVDDVMDTLTEEELIDILSCGFKK